MVRHANKKKVRERENDTGEERANLWERESRLFLKSHTNNLFAIETT